jgi:hypothetical protein
LAKRKRRDPNKKPFQLRPPQPRYPIATIAFYGPDDRTATKIAVGIVDQHSQVLDIKRWTGSDVATNPEIKAGIDAFITEHRVKDVVITEGILGCPHEEGIDFPEGEDCPHCPFWQGKQGTAAQKDREISVMTGSLQHTSNDEEQGTR